MFLGAAAFLAVCCSCGGEAPEDRAAEMDRPLPDQVLSDFSVTETASGKKEWKMTARKAYIYDSRHLLEAEDMEVEFFNEQGEVKSRLVARRGTVNRSTDDMQARGNVVVTGNAGVTLETETLSWLSKSRRISTDDSVRVIREGDVLTGVGFRGDPDLGSFEILRDMKAKIRVREAGDSGGSGD